MLSHILTVEISGLIQGKMTKAWISHSKSQKQLMIRTWLQTNRFWEEIEINNVRVSKLSIQWHFSQRMELSFSKQMSRFIKSWWETSTCFLRVWKTKFHLRSILSSPWCRLGAKKEGRTGIKRLNWMDISILLTTVPLFLKTRLYNWMISNRGILRSRRISLVRKNLVSILNTALICKVLKSKRIEMALTRSRILPLPQKKELA